MGVIKGYQGPAFKPASFLGAFEHKRVKSQDVFEGQMKKKQMRSRVDRQMMPNQQATRITGDMRRAALEKYLFSFGLEPSGFQKEAWDQMERTLIPHLYKDDLDANLDRILREKGWDDLQWNVMAITPRRFGKTYSVGMFVAAAAMSIEGLEQAVFSTGRRASEKLLQLIVKLLNTILPLDPNMKVIKQTNETIWIQGPQGPNDIRKIFCYPSKVKIESTKCLFFVVFLVCGEVCRCCCCCYGVCVCVDTQPLSFSYVCLCQFVVMQVSSSQVKSSQVIMCVCMYAMCQ